jgi:biotin synthase-related radical SAM superfamily protein
LNALVGGMLTNSTSHSDSEFPYNIRVSVGSAIVLELLEGKLDAKPTTAYLMTYSASKCSANCLFCPQARTSLSKAELLSRISWPAFQTRSVVNRIGTAANQGRINRVCVQALIYPRVFSELVALVKTIKLHAAVPVSVSCQPTNNKDIRLLRAAGVNRIGIAIDAASPKLLAEVKGSGANGTCSWEGQFAKLREAVEVFGKGNVSTHLIVGLGETEKETTSLIQECVEMTVLPALFAFTPIRGTALETRVQPKVTVYRRIQVARYLIVNKIARFSDMVFGVDGRIVSFGVEKDVLKGLVEGGEPFLTSGCPGCNRPFYNEKASGPMYNYPRSILPEEIVAIKRDLAF